MEIKNIILLFVMCSAIAIITIIRERKMLGLNKYNEALTLIVPKGYKEKLKSIANLKGFPTESDYILDIIEEEIKKNQEKLNK